MCKDLFFSMFLELVSYNENKKNVISRSLNKMYLLW